MKLPLLVNEVAPCGYVRIVGGAGPTVCCDRDLLNVLQLFLDDLSQLDEQLWDLLFIEISPAGNFVPSVGVGVVENDGFLLPLRN